MPPVMVAGPLGLEGVRAGGSAPRRPGRAAAEGFFHAAADVGQGVPVCPFGEPGGACDAVELLVYGYLDVGNMACWRSSGG